MLLELCDESLKDWLNRRISLSTDDLEAILGFSLNIASGVEHLHSHKVSRRPLSMHVQMMFYLIISRFCH